MTQTATDKQINYALALLGKAGFNTRYMDKHDSALGARMRQRSGTVEAWLRDMRRHEISSLIDDLKARTNG